MAEGCGHGIAGACTRCSEEKLRREHRAMRELLERMTSATSISHFHALLCEAKELLGTDGVETHREGQHG